MALDRRLGDVYISIHAPREGSDGYAEANSGKRWKFLSTLPARGATTPPKRAARSRSISIHAPREGSDAGGNGGIPIKSISIHAPREGSDRFRWIRGSRLCHFYPRSPRGERPEPASEPEQPAKFLSTLPARGATEQLDAYRALLDNFYPRSPRGERRRSAACFRRRCDFYPRSPRGERRPSGSSGCGKHNFYPRSPRGERPSPFGISLTPRGISIHAPREGSDTADRAAAASHTDFYPRSPRGERPVAVQSCARTDTFLSTLPARGATARAASWAACSDSISIHAPREGSDQIRLLLLPPSKVFLSTLPARGATRRHRLFGLRVQHFYPRSPRGERLFSPSSTRTS